jgi:hypothetical protein
VPFQPSPITISESQSRSDRSYCAASDCYGIGDGGIGGACIICRESLFTIYLGDEASFRNGHRQHPCSPVLRMLKVESAFGESIEIGWQAKA